MRLVVGPLSAATYWRRRAMVVGGVILAVLIVMYSCTAAGKTNPTTGPSNSATPKSDPTPTATSGAVAPVTQVSPSPSAAPAPIGDPQLCTDAELSVTAAPDKTTVASGTSLTIKLLVKNISSRSCSRDVGADFQELRIVLGTEKVWSSDDCGGLAGTDLRTFPPNHERSYVVIWNGKSSRSCTQAEKPAPSGPSPTAGEYQIIARVGTDLSEPITLKIT